MNSIYEFVEYEKNIPAKIICKDMNALDFQVPAHWHESVEFDLMLQGDAGCVINGRETAVGCGNFMFINSGEIHSIDVKDTRARYRSVVVLLSYDLLRQQFEPMDQYYFSDVSQGLAAQLISSILCEIGRVYEDKASFYQTKLNSLLFELCYVLLSRCMVKKESVYPANLEERAVCAKQAISYVNRRYQEKIEVPFIAGYVGLQKNYFCRYFKEKTGDSFVQFLNKVRLYHALRQYLEGDGTVLECAVNNGFASAQAFEKACKKIHGCTPGEYRKNALGPANKQGAV